MESVSAHPSQRSLRSWQSRWFNFVLWAAILTFFMVFLRAVDAALACRGRLVVTGMGKSGHIGNKIAATLASTGTPAFFLHPGEAPGHGVEIDEALAAKYPYQRAYLPVNRQQHDGTLWDW